MHETCIRDISYGEREPRRAICARVETPFGDLHALATHLGLSIRERRSQARALLEMIGDAIALHRAWRFQRLVLAGLGAIGPAVRPARPLAQPHLSVMVPAAAARPHLLPATRSTGADLDRRPSASHLGSFAGDW